MEITTRDYKQASIIHVAGRVDSPAAMQLDAKLDEYVNYNRVYLVLEMDQTDYLCSAGVRALVSALKAVKPRNGRIVIVAPSEHVYEVMRCAGLLDLFPIYDSVEDAVKTV